MQVDVAKRTVLLESQDILDLINLRHNGITIVFNNDLWCTEAIPSPSFANLEFYTLVDAARKELKNNLLCVHYIATAGYEDDDTQPAYSTTFDSLGGAVEQLRSIYNLSETQVNTLVEEQFVLLELRRHGIEYVQIEECACDDGDEHVSTP
jgi:hypothetical protein